MPKKEDLSWTKSRPAKRAAKYTKEETRLLATHPNEAQGFLNSTRENEGASLYLKSMNLIQPGDPVYLVGKEPSERTGKPVRTRYVDKGNANPSLSTKQFAEHLVRLKKEAPTDPKAVMGSWIDTKTPESTKKGVQMDLSGAYKDREVAEKKMIDRNEDAIADASNYFANIYHEDVRHKYTDTPRPSKED
jgi:hypothetical protein